MTLAPARFAKQIEVQVRAYVSKPSPTTLAHARTICLANRGEQSPYYEEIASDFVLATTYSIKGKHESKAYCIWIFDSFFIGM